jgi:hypothetical protein
VAAGLLGACGHRRDGFHRPLKRASSAPAGQMNWRRTK